MTNTEPLDENSWRMGRDAAAREIADAQANVQEALGLLAEARTALVRQASWNVGNEYCWCWYKGDTPRPNNPTYDHHADCIAARDLLTRIDQAEVVK